MRGILRGSLLFVALAAPAAADEQTVACKRDGVVRNVMVVGGPDSAHACEVRYQRASEGGSPQLLWHAQSDPDFCDSQAAALVSRLEQAGWSCSHDTATDSASNESQPLSVPAALGVPEGLTAATKTAPAIDPALLKLRPTLH
jgi:hypothetical protein